MTMRRLIWILVLLLLLLSQPAAAARPIPGVLQPDAITVLGNRAFIAEGSRIHVFRLPGLEPAGVLAGDGDGPGEFRTHSGFGMTLDLFNYNGKLAAASPRKLAVFSAAGKLVREWRLGHFCTRVRLHQHNPVVIRYLPGVEMAYELVRLEKDLSPAIRIAAQPIAYTAGEINTVNPLFQFWIWKDHVFVLQGLESLSLTEHTAAGDKVRAIALPVKGPLVDNAMRKRITRWLRSQSWYRMIPEQHRRTLRFPKRLPALLGGILHRDRLILITRLTGPKGTECLVVPLDGRPVFRRVLPVQLRDVFTPAPYCAAGNRFYALKERADEQWVLETISLDAGFTGGDA